MLLFHAGGSQRMAVPLGLVARLEDIPREKIEMSCGSPVTQYRGKLMPLISMGGDDPNSDKPTQPLLVFAEGGRTMGLMVDEIVDVVDDRLEIELAGARPGLLGSAVIGGHATDVLDTGYWLMQAWEDWFRGAPRQGDSVGQKHILLVDDSDFFRQLIVPTLNAAGLRVTAVSSAAEALRLRENGNMYDAIVSDIEMPDMDGLQFARAIRAGGIWAELPLDRDDRAHRPAIRAGGAPGRISPITSPNSSGRRWSPACAATWRKRSLPDPRYPPDPEKDPVCPAMYWIGRRSRPTTNRCS